MAEKQEVVTISIRFPNSLHREIVELKETHHRSFNKQVVFMLREYLKYLEAVRQAQELKSQANG